MGNSEGSLIVLNKVDSTNNYAMGLIHSGMAKNGIAVMALDQTSGKGRNQKVWKTLPGENLTISFICDTSMLPVHKQFHLSMLASLACCDLFKSLGAFEVKIKWPNDIYVDDKKSGGILIENIIQGQFFKWSVIGIGLNINQTDFPPEIKATSILNITGTKNQINKVGHSLKNLIEKRMNNLNQINSEGLLEEYNTLLYARGQKKRFKTANISFETTINQVNIHGELLTTDSVPRCFKFDEVQWIL